MEETKKPTIDEVIFNIEDYVGGNIEGVENIDHMGFTVFLRQQLESLNPPKNNGIEPSSDVLKREGDK